jgi:hypothetical protein
MLLRCAGCEDAATIDRARKLLREDSKAYWKGEALQEAMAEALERQQTEPCRRVVACH